MEGSRGFGVAEVCERRRFRDCFWSHQSSASAKPDYVEMRLHRRTASEGGPYRKTREFWINRRRWEVRGAELFERRRFRD